MQVIGPAFMEDPTLEVAGVRGQMRFIEPGGQRLCMENELQ